MSLTRAVLVEVGQTPDYSRLKRELKERNWIQ